MRRESQEGKGTSNAAPAVGAAAGCVQAQPQQLPQIRPIMQLTTRDAVQRSVTQKRPL